MTEKKKEIMDALFEMIEGNNKKINDLEAERANTIEELQIQVAKQSPLIHTNKGIIQALVKIDELID